MDEGKSANENGRLFSMGSCLPPLFPIFPSIRHSQRRSGRKRAGGILPSLQYAGSRSRLNPNVKIARSTRLHFIAR
jgi:hypothetical protein